MPIFLLCALFCRLPAAGKDWPTRLHDIRRGGITSEKLKLPLTEVWTHITARPPTPAWTESPARHDFYHNYLNLKPRQNFDRCFDIAVVGNFLYYGSSRTGIVSCLHTSSGQEVWSFFTDGPVRFAPCLANGKVYLGSDDGYAYCLNAGDGSLVWKEKVGPTDRMIWGNEHMISVWPVRSSLLVDGPDVFWTAGIFPEEGTYICKRNAADGSGGWTRTAQLPPQGYLLATHDYLFVPTGKTYPTVYNRTSGTYVGYVRNNARDGGCWALLTPDETYIWAGPNVRNQTQQFRAGSRTYIASINGANFLIADSSYSYYNTDIKIYKIKRSNRSLVWITAYSYPYALIKAGDTLFAGGDGEIAAFDTNGVRVWTASVDGKAYGLAVANGRLYASTDKGSIHCFSAATPIVKNDEGASNIMADSADLNGNLISTGCSASAQVSVFWGATDGGTTTADWDHRYDFGLRTAGSLSINVTGLSPGTNYYRFYAKNACGQCWADSSWRFATPDDLSQWTHKMKIQFTGYDNAEILTNFPVLVIFNEVRDNFAYSQFTSISGGDLRFTDAHETILLNYEIEEWNTTGNSYIWVRVPEIAGSEDYIWAYWGNANENTPPTYTTDGSSWDTNFIGVWHLDQINGVEDLRDSTANSNDGVDNASANAAGKIADAQSFANTYVDCGDSNFQLSDGTIVGWFFIDSWMPRAGIIAKDRSGYCDDFEIMRDRSGTNKLHFEIQTPNPNTQRSVKSDNEIPLNTWTHFAVTWGSGGMKMWINGIQQADTNAWTGGIAATGQSLWIGKGQYWGINGRIDEVRVSNIARSPDWIRAGWKNQALNDEFISYGTVQLNRNP